MSWAIGSGVQRGELVSLTSVARFLWIVSVQADPREWRHDIYKKLQTQDMNDSIRGRGKQGPAGAGVSRGQASGAVGFKRGGADDDGAPHNGGPPRFFCQHQIGQGCSVHRLQATDQAYGFGFQVAQAVGKKAVGQGGKQRG